MNTSVPKNRQNLVRRTDKLPCGSFFCHVRAFADAFGRQITARYCVKQVFQITQFYHYLKATVVEPKATNTYNIILVYWRSIFVGKFIVYIVQYRLITYFFSHLFTRSLLLSSICSLIRNNIWYLGKSNLCRTSLCHCVRLLAEVITKVLTQGKVFIP